jgi:protein-S-isoprenylcysteine O-methyltransferase Ste14
MSDHEPPDHAGVAIHPPILLGLCLGAGFLAHRVLPLPFLARGVSSVAGPILTGGSLALFAWAVLTMRRAGASIPTHEPTEAIVVRGPYGYSRNPIYLSMLALQVGVALWANSLWFIVLAAVAAFVLSRGVIAREERYLERKLGSEYSSYRDGVRRWIGRYAEKPRN